MPNGAELTGWFEYLRMDDEIRANWMSYAIVQSFTTKKKATDTDDEEVVDTTAPEFSEKFRGFTTTRTVSKNPVQKGTEILQG